tara:strand:+ start:491 stop:1417 length:927 start_codon:yes stop_codon:yes gene_type:complete
MLVHKLRDSYKPNRRTIITIGNYDGIHKGHIYMLEKLTHLAKDNNLDSVLITFNPHTKTVVNQADFKVITTLEDKIILSDQLNIDFLCEVEFNNTIKSLSYKEFIEIIINKYHPSIILIGYDNKFGKNRDGTYELLKEHLKETDIEVLECQEYDSNDCKVTTTNIKNNINKYNICLANKLLGRNYSLKGKVVNGENIGKNIGYPTANIKINSFEQLIPPNGVYSVTLEVDNKKYKSICNIGYCPTIKKNSVEITIEVHVINQNLQLYGKDITIEFIDFIRKEHKFNTKEDLVKQIKKDILKVNLKGYK